MDVKNILTRYAIMHPLQPPHSIGYVCHLCHVLYLYTHADMLIMVLYVDGTNISVSNFVVITEVKHHLFWVLNEGFGSATSFSTRRVAFHLRAIYCHNPSIVKRSFIMLDFLMISIDDTLIEFHAKFSLSNDVLFDDPT